MKVPVWGDAKNKIYILIPTISFLAQLSMWSFVLLVVLIAICGLLLLDQSGHSVEQPEMKKAWVYTCAPAVE